MNKTEVANTIKRILKLSDNELIEIANARNMSVEEIKWSLENLTNDETLYRYRTCALCGKESVKADELEKIIGNSNSVQEVIDRIGMPNCQHFLNMN